MGESLTDYPPTTKYTWPLKVTIFINFPESFFLFQSIMFVCGVHVVQCPQPRCTSNKNSKRIAKPLFRKETPGTQHLGEPYSIQKPTFHGLKGCYVTHQFSHLSWKRICQFPMKYIITFQVWDGQINTCNSWLAILCRPQLVRTSLKVHPSSSSLAVALIWVHHWCKNQLKHWAMKKGHGLHSIKLVC